MTKRLLRSTSVAIACMRLPMSRSPSQWPGTARSFASAGRSRMLSVPRNWPWPFITGGLSAGGSCARNADSESVPCVTRRGTARTTTGRSSRATRASPDRRGTLPPANPRSVAVTNAARASPRRLPATGDTPPTSRPSGDELERPRSISATRPIAARTTVACDLPRDRRRRPAQPARDRTARLARSQTPRDLLPLTQRQPQRRTDRLRPAPAAATSARCPHTVRW